MSKPIARVLHTEQDLSKCLDVIVAAFHTTALTNGFISEIDNKPPPFDTARRRQHFGPSYDECIRGGATFVEAGDWSAVAVWEPADYAGHPFATTGTLKPMRAAWRQEVARCKAKHVNQPHWHLDFLARNPDKPSVPGAITAVLKPFLDRATAAHQPVWLEATDLKAVRIYKHFGFEVVEEIPVGAGMIDSKGWPMDGGTGVIGYCMVRPVSTPETQDPVS